MFKLTRFFNGLKRYILFLSILLISIQLHSEEVKIGLALSGGGARGLAHIGVLKVLDELDLQIDYISGTSIGAVIGGLYALGYSAVQIEEIVLNQFEWDLIRLDSVARPDYYIGEKRWGNQYNWTFQLNENFHPQLPQGFIVGNKFINIFFNHVYPYSHIEDFSLLPIPFAAVATDLLTGEMVILDSGNIHEALRASMSVPSIFAPFEMEEYLLIDGGIKMNLPSTIVRDMGADYIIGVQVTSELREKERLTNPITVLDQTINISSSERTLESLDHCSLIIEPTLEDLRATDFNKIPEIIAAGEQAARELLPELLQLARRQQKDPLNKPLPLSESITYNRIIVEGNQHVSGSKIREYSGLTTNVPLSKEEILAGTQAVYNSNLFNQTYPVIRKTPEGYDLIIKVTEKPRNQLGINVRYNNSDDIILGGVVEMRNYIGNNSNLMIGMSIGGQRELLFDYVKNFGREWGVYFRIFPYINEHTLYLFNENQEKISSSNALEYGSVFGIGAYALNRFIIESYLFSYNKMLYRNISEYYIDDHFFSSGIGLKFYYETFDDLVFPMTGQQTLLKYSYADENVLSDFSYKKFYGRFQNLFPIMKSTSLKLQFEYGSFFDDETIDFDPFYVGGFDSFLGMYQYEQSAPVIKILTLAGRIEMTRNLFVDLQLNIGNTGNFDLWKIDPSTLFGGGVKLGYMTMIGPLRGGFGFNRRGKFLTYISLGYDYDIFEFSRR